MADRPINNDDLITIIRPQGGHKPEYRTIEELNNKFSTEEQSELTDLQAKQATAGAPTMPVAATGSIDLGGGVSLDFTAQTAGAAGNNLIVNLIDPEAENATIDVVVNGNKIDVTLASSAVPAITSTAADVKAALDGTPSAVALIATAITGLDTTVAVKGTAELASGVNGTAGVSGAIRYEASKLWISVGDSTAAVSNWKYAELT